MEKALQKGKEIRCLWKHQRRHLACGLSLEYLTHLKEYSLPSVALKLCHTWGLITNKYPFYIHCKYKSRRIKETIHLGIFGAFWALPFWRLCDLPGAAKSNRTSNPCTKQSRNFAVGWGGERVFSVYHFPISISSSKFRQIRSIHDEFIMHCMIMIILH